MPLKEVTFLVEGQENLVGVEVTIDYTLCDLRRCHLPAHTAKKFGVFFSGDILPGGAIVIKRWKSKSKVKL